MKIKKLTEEAVKDIYSVFVTENEYNPRKKTEKHRYKLYATDNKDAWHAVWHWKEGTPYTMLDRGNGDKITYVTKGEEPGTEWYISKGRCPDEIYNDYINRRIAAREQHRKEKEEFDKETETWKDLPKPEVNSIDDYPDLQSWIDKQRYIQNPAYPESYLRKLEDMMDLQLRGKVEHDRELKRKGVKESLIESTANSNGIYSLYNGWLKEPVRDEIPEVDLEPELTNWVEKSEECKDIAKINEFIDDLYRLRQESILKEGEYGKGNLIFKEIRNRGILNDLKTKKVNLENKEMSIEEDLEQDLADELYKVTADDLFNKYANRQLDISDLDDIFEDIAREYNDTELAEEVCERLEVYLSNMYESLIWENLHNDDDMLAESKLIEKENKVVDWYHRAMEAQSLPEEYDRNNPTIDRDILARASNKFGFGAEKLEKLLKGEFNEG